MLFKKKKKTYDPFLIQSGRYASKKSAHRYNLEWSDEAAAGITSKAKLGRGFNLRRLFKFKLLFIIFFIILISRISWLQVVNGAYYRQLSENNRIRLERIEARRGIIYDTNMRPMVNNVANWLLYFIPADLPKDKTEKKELVSRVSYLLGNMSAAEINNIIKEIKEYSFESYQPLFITDHIDYERAMLLYLETANMPGVVLTSQNMREYDLVSLSLSHILGYTGMVNKEELDSLGQDYSPIDYVGKTGLEYFWESELRGLNGQKQIEVDAIGKEKKIISQTKVDDGHNLVLSIDSQVQAKLEEILKDHMDKLNLSKAVAIVMNPNNGEIISLINLPSFNNNLFASKMSQEEYSILAEHPDQPLFMRAVSGEYPSGSTIKPVILSAALEEGIVNQYTAFLSVGGIKIGSWFFPDWKAGGHGLTDARKAISESVNTYFYHIGGGYNDFQGLGIEKMVQYFKLFGLGSQTGIDLSGEADGFLPSKDWKKKTKNEPWYIGDTYHIAIGQGDLLVTPLQIAYFTSFFANKGSLYRPHLVKNVLTSDDKLITEIDTTPVKTGFIESKHINVVREGMRQAVTSGSAVRLNSLPVEVAGKTGTAQWSTKYDPHAWFTGFAPYDNPEIVITILIEQGGDGSRVAVPIVEQFLYWYFTK
ncbi:MAG: penicillin-binding protein 2 [bacterium]